MTSATAKRAGTTNTSLHAARAARNDEFYTQRADIERELGHYKDHFKGKVVFCNCDDPAWSEFFWYFKANFEFLGLKKLITTHYCPENAEGKRAYKLEYDGVGEAVETPLEGDGDFRSSECVELLKQSDIVVTNPPFSLFREYVAQLVDHDKQFLIIGNNNAITYREIFKLIKENKLWLGISPRSMTFKQPNDTLKSVNACWYTNLAHSKRNEELLLTKRAEDDPSAYPRYDNYDAIEVGRVSDIPCDYMGPMGVPITFLDKYNPNQFEILGAMTTTSVDEFNFGYPYVNGVRKYARIVVRRRTSA
ncbi:adenine-specific methyltransferase EcoRI family protein [Azohydromonas sediminis]|uniref:adenine-specific methyltransferase EcoRI family protein n=1 Tax=Azohydromonas sediminis TaxID=2259674 RepID=UPI000E64DF62|nr:adenine-specific methyltransferase EcoRI family protein [Azohydromonas sediminis]